MSLSTFAQPRIKRLLNAALPVALILSNPGFIPSHAAQIPSVTIAVNLLSDDRSPTGECAQSGIMCLRKAIQIASQPNSSTLIMFSVSGTIVLQATLDIQGLAPLTIDGHGQSIALDGNSKVGVLMVGSDTTLNDLTIQNGGNNGYINSDMGGGINVIRGSLTIKNSTLSHNSNDSNGGAISISKAGKLTIDHSIVIYNSTNAFGGGIFSCGETAITNSTISGNSAVAGGGLFVCGHASLIASTISDYNSGLKNGVNHDQIGTADAPARSKAKPISLEWRRHANDGTYGNQSGDRRGILRRIYASREYVACH